MFPILETSWIAPTVKWFKVEAPDISKKARAGQFVIVRAVEEGERIPLTIADFDSERTIEMVVQEVGASSSIINSLEKGDAFLNIAGPLGHPSEIEKFGTVVCIGGGIGIAPVFPISRKLKEAGNKIISILGARSKDLLFWEDRFDTISDEMIICTDDGSRGRKGVVTDPLKELISSDEDIDRVVAIGPPIMMKFVAATTEPHRIKTIVSLNPIMMDGTGMCGGCRVNVGGETRFACVDGPEFDGHKVDFDLLMDRLDVYHDEEEECKLAGRFE